MASKYKKEVEKYYSVFDLFILTSRIEGTPISMLEAMSCCVPIFVTPVGGIPDITKGLDGTYFISGNPKEDRANISNVIFGEANFYNNLREYIVENHNIEDVYYKFFSNLISGSLACNKREDQIMLSGEFI